MATQNEILGNPYYLPVLDHGFVGLVQQDATVTVDVEIEIVMPSGQTVKLEPGTKVPGIMPSVMGNDGSIVQAARTSYGRGTKHVSEDRGLIRYLMRHLHTTPMEMVEFKFHIKQPIFVTRQWIRHRTANVNEYSGRYSIMPNEFYIPTPDLVQPQSTNNKQGRAGQFTQKEIDYCIKKIQKVSQSNFADYIDLIGEMSEEKTDLLSRITSNIPIIGRRKLSAGLAKELARIILPLNNYTEFYWKIDLHNLFHFLALRLDAHAQKEIQLFAQAVYELIKPHVPLAVEAFEDYRLKGGRLSRMEIELLKKLINYDLYKSLPTEEANMLFDEVGLSSREVREFKDRWGL